MLVMHHARPFHTRVLITLTLSKWLSVNCVTPVALRTIPSVCQVIYVKYRTADGDASGKMGLVQKGGFSEKYMENTYVRIKTRQTNKLLCAVFKIIKIVAILSH